jgi:hypothetical protein
VRLVNGDEVVMNGAHSGDIRYEDTLLARVDDKPLVGDRVRVLAQAGRTESYVSGYGYVKSPLQLYPRVAQVMVPSEARAELVAGWDQEVKGKLEKLGANGAADVPQELTDLLESAVYVEDGHRTKLGLTMEQRLQAATQVEALFAGNESSMPLIVPLLKNPNDRAMFDAVYAAREGTPVFGMTADSLRQFVLESVVNKGAYDAEVHDDLTSTYRVFQSTFPGKACAEVARAAWDQIKVAEDGPHIIGRRIGALRDITYRSDTSDMAAVWREVVLSGKVSMLDASEYIGNALHIIAGGRVEPTEDIKKAVAIYSDAIRQLNEKADSIEDDKRRDRAQYHLGEANRALSSAQIRLRI